jgi:hypothetical protein
MVLNFGWYSSIIQNLGMYSGLRRREIDLEMGKQITIENAFPTSGNCFFSVCKLFCFIFFSYQAFKPFFVPQKSIFFLSNTIINSNKIIYRRSSLIYR